MKLNALASLLQRPEIRSGIQAAAGFAILVGLLSPPPVWNALTLRSASISPVYAVVSFSVVMQGNVGTALNFVMQRLTAALFITALGLLCVALTFACNALSYHESLTKSAFMTLFSTLFGFCLALAAYRFPKYWFGFIVASLFLPIASLSAFHLPYPEWIASAYFLMQVTIGVAMGAVVPMLILPNTAGANITATTCFCLTTLGQGSNNLLHLFISEGGDGVQNGGGSGENENIYPNSDGTDAAVPPESLALFEELWAVPVSNALVKAKALLFPVSTEVDPYHTPHVFPKDAYASLVILLRHYLSTLMTLVYLAEGEAPLRAVRALRQDILPVAQHVQTCFSAAAGVLQRKPGASYVQALETLSALERSLHSLSVSKLASNTSADDNRKNKDVFTEGELVMADTMIAIVFSLGTRLRRLYFVLPEAVAWVDSGAREAWRQHFKGQKWDFHVPDIDSVTRSLSLSGMVSLPTPTGTPSLGQMVSEAKSPMSSHHIARLSSIPLPTTSAATVATSATTITTTVRGINARARKALASPRDLSPGRKQKKENKKSMKKVLSASFPPPIAAAATVDTFDSDHVDHQTEHRGMSWLWLWQWCKKAIERFSTLSSSLCNLESPPLPWGITGESIALSLQLWAALVGATLLHVSTSSWRALNEQTIWIPVTVAVMAQKSVGGVVLRGANRLAGTVAAAAMGLAILYFVYLVNGLSYANTVAKFVTMTTVLSVTSGLLMYASMKVPHQYMYAFTVLKLTLPIITLVGYSDEELLVTTALYRIANISIGLGIHLVATVLVFPVSTQDAVSRRVCRVLRDLADIAAGEASKLLQQEKQSKSGSTSSAATSPATSPMSKSERRRQRQAQRQQQMAMLGIMGGGGGGVGGGAAGGLMAYPAPPGRSRSISPSIEGLQRAPSTAMAMATRTSAATANATPTSTALSSSPPSPNVHDQFQKQMGVPQVAHPDPLPPHNLHIRTTSTDHSTLYETPSSSGMKTMKSAFATATAAAAAPIPEEGEQHVTHIQASPPSPSPLPSPSLYYFDLASPTKKRHAFHKKRSLWIRKIVYGEPMQQLGPLGEDAATLLAGLAELEMISEFEDKAFPSVLVASTQTPEQLRQARRALRRMLNSLLSFVYVLDGPDEPHLRLLLPFRPEIDALMEQVSECLMALAGVVAGTLPLHRVSLTQQNLRGEVQDLLEEVERAPPALGSTQADVVLGYAALGVLVAAVQTLSQTTDAVLQLCLSSEAFGTDVDVDVDVDNDGSEHGGGGNVRKGLRPSATAPSLTAVPSHKDIKALRVAASAQALLSGRGGAGSTGMLSGEPSAMDLVGLHPGSEDRDRESDTDAFDEDLEIGLAHYGLGGG